MAYKIGQYQHDSGPLVNNWSVKAFSYVPMTLEIEDTTSAMDTSAFKNESFPAADGVYSADSTYYVHCKIKRKANETQVFNIKLVNNTETTTGSYVDSTDDNNTQYITTATVTQGQGWTDLEFIFTPMAAYDTILFELRRSRNDYIYTPRRGCILMMEVSNITKISAINNQTRKIGVKSNPGFLFTLNGNAIRVGNSGIYEMNNDMVVITKFGTCCPDDMSTDTINNYLNELLLKYEDYIGRCYGVSKEFETNINAPSGCTKDYCYNTTTKVWYKKINNEYKQSGDGWNIATFNDEYTDFAIGDALPVGVPTDSDSKLYECNTSGDHAPEGVGTDTFTSTYIDRTSFTPVKTFNTFIVDYLYKEEE